jgi:hypothetical protein
LNLIENIQRISTLISEDKKEDTIRTMIDKMGVSNAIKLVGNYYTIEPYLKEIDKVNYIKERIIELGDGGGFGLVEIDEEPIHYGDEDGELHQIEWLGTKSVDISIYNDEMGAHLNDYYVNYENLSVEVIERLVEMLLKH